MLWELSVAEQRYRAVLEVGMGVPVTVVAERYGVSRQSVHAWLVRYRQEGIAGLEDRSHQVHNHPWRIIAEVEELICELRRGHPKWGPRRLVFEMGRRGHQVTRSTVYRTLVRNGLVEAKARRRRRKDYRRWERGTPMELWQLDVTASAFLTSGTEVKIVTGVDDHSRFCVLAKAVMRATARPVCLAFVEAMRAYGVPEEVLTDNGKVFTGRFHKPGVAVEVLFDKICRENGITHRLTKIHSPTTTGKIERLHQTLQRELLDVHGPFESIEALQAALDAWRREYNTDRPHQSLGMNFPASRFTPASSPLELRIPAQLTASTGQPKPPPLGPGSPPAPSLPDQVHNHPWRIIAEVEELICELRRGHPKWDLFGYRWAFRCTTDSSSDVVLGHGWASEGYTAASIDPLARGVGWLLSETGVPRRIKAAYLEDDDIAYLARYAAKLRHGTEAAA